MDKFLLNLNDRVEIKYDGQTYKAIVQDVTEETFSINIPVYNGEYLTLHAKELIEIMTYNTKDDFRRIYKFQQKVITRKIEENGMHLYIIKKPQNAELVQRREHVRVEVTQLIKYVKGDYKIDEFKSLEKENGIILDISEGGVRLKTREELKLGDKLVLGMNFEEFEKEIVAKGNVIRVKKIDNKEVVYGIQFENIDKKSKEYIMHLVFKIIRRQRKVL